MQEAFLGHVLSLVVGIPIGLSMGWFNIVEGLFRPVFDSSGMKQRVGIARAYANAPNIMLLDEPFRQLDAQPRMFMQKETARIWEQEKRTVIFVTNNIAEALFLGDRIVLMEGKLPGTIKTEYQIDLPRPREHARMELLKRCPFITDNTALILYYGKRHLQSPCRLPLRGADLADHAGPCRTPRWKRFGPTTPGRTMDHPCAPRAPHDTGLRDFPRTIFNLEEQVCVSRN